MRKREIITTLLLVLILFSFSSCVGELVYREESNTFEYNDSEYILFYDDPGVTAWAPLPSGDQTKVSGTVTGKAYTRAPVLTTNEENPNFIIVLHSFYDVTNVSCFNSAAYIRDDIAISSVFDTDFETVRVEYSEDVLKEDRRLDHITDGMSFEDFVGADNPETEAKPKESKYYCTIYCTYPDIPYLQCYFEVIDSDGQLYLEVREEDFVVRYFCLE